MFNIFLSIVSALVLTLAFPAANFYLLAWVALIPFFFTVLQEKSYFKLAVNTLCFSLVFYWLSSFWFQAFYRWVFPWVVNFGWLAYTLSQAVFLIPVILLFKLLQNNLNLKNKFLEKIALALSLSFLWVLFDWLRSLGIFGNLVGQIAYSQYLFLPFIQLAKYIGCHGLSFILVLFNITMTFLIADLLADKNLKHWRHWLSSLAVIALCFIVLGIFFKAQIKTALPLGLKSKNIAVYQPNIPQENKLNSAYYEELKNKYLAEIKYFFQYHQADLIVLPETIIPEFLLNDKYFLLSLSDALDSDIIFGTPRWKNRSINLEYFNSLVLLNKYGELLGYHDKRYLVPFGEYVPFRKYLYWFFQGTGFLETEYSIGNTPDPMDEYGAAICFESTLPYQARQKVKHGAQVLVVSTNDAWFGKAPVLEHHLAFGVLRAVENNRYFIQAANTGISAIVDQHGQIIAKTQVDQEQWLKNKVYFLTEQTFYTKYGEIIIYLGFVYLIFLVYIILTKTKS